MNLDYDKQLEREIERELQGLPESPAPHDLILRVMRAIESRACLPWYRQSWQRWPMPLRAVSFVLLLALFGGICFGSWRLMHTEMFLTAMNRVGGWFAGASALWNALNAVLSTLVLLVNRLGMGVIIGCLMAMAMGYAMCLGLGTVWVRMALARR